MPAIANAVNAFTSEGVQQLAFQALIRSFAGDAGESIDESNPQARNQIRRRGPTGERAEMREGKPASRKRRSSTPTFVRDLDLRPKEKQSFKDFAATKSPESNHERSAVSVYWLTQIADVSGVTIDHVYTCYKEANWKVPPNLANSLAVTANKKGWLNTEDMQNLRVTVPGENLVEHDLPRKGKSS